MAGRKRHFGSQQQIKAVASPRNHLSLLCKLGSRKAAELFFCGDRQDSSQLAAHFDSQFATLGVEPDLINKGAGELEGFSARSRILQRFLQLLDFLSVDLGEIRVEQWYRAGGRREFLLQQQLSSFLVRPALLSAPRTGDIVLADQPDDATDAKGPVAIRPW